MDCFWKGEALGQTLGGCTCGWIKDTQKKGETGVRESVERASKINWGRCAKEDERPGGVKRENHRVKNSRNLARRGGCCKYSFKGDSKGNEQKTGIPREDKL